MNPLDEDLLRRALHEEAAALTPAGDGLARIQERARRRRVRARWLRPTLGAATAAGLAAAAVVAYTSLSPAAVGRQTLVAPAGSPTSSPGTALVRRTTPAPATRTHAARPAATAPAPATTSPAPAAAPAYPPVFVAATAGGRLASFDSATGSLLRYLTAPQLLASDPQLSADGAWVYFLRSYGTCKDEVWRVPAAGGTAHVFAAGIAATSGFGVSADGRDVATVNGGCGSSGTDLVVRDLRTGRTHDVAIPSAPPSFAGNPAWSAGGSKVYVTLQRSAANGSAIVAMDPWTSTTAASVPAVGCGGCSSSQPMVDAHGVLFYLGFDGSAVTLREQGRSSALVTLPGAGIPAAVAPAVDGAGSAAVWTVEANGGEQLWRWSGTAPVLVRSLTTATSVTW